MMRLPVRFLVFAAALAAFALCSAGRAAAQSRSSQPGQTQPAPTPGAGVGTYTPTNPLAGVSYDNKYDLSLGMAYDHMKAGPTLVQGAHLGGLDLTGSRWFTRHWGVQASGRAYIGTSGAGLNFIPTGGYLKGPMVKQYFFVGGPEWLGPHNQHGAMLAHFLVGGVYGDFQKDLLGYPPAKFDFYYNQVAPAAIIGGSFDLNRSARWVFRVTPDAVMTHYTYSNEPYSSQKYGQFDVNFAISVGLEYKFKGKRFRTKR